MPAEATRTGRLLRTAMYIPQHDVIADILGMLAFSSIGQRFADLVGPEGALTPLPKTGAFQTEHPDRTDRRRGAGIYFSLFLL